MFIYRCSAILAHYQLIDRPNTNRGDANENFIVDGMYVSGFESVCSRLR
jgi:hypothetical protein